MLIIFPIGGRGERFKKENYSQPKPLIKIHGKEMIFHVFDGIRDNVQDSDTIFIIYTRELTEYNFEIRVKKYLSNIKNIKFHVLDFQTKGAIHTLYTGLKNTNFSINQKVITFDCDTIYNKDLNLLTSLRLFKKSGIVYFRDTQDQAIFSYITLDSNGMISDIKEKERISNFANTGCYMFKSLSLLNSYISKINFTTTIKELYISQLYELMLRNNEKIYGIQISKDDFDCVGTPTQLKIYCENAIIVNPLRICFDLDKTLVTEPTIKGDYSTVKPIQKNIDYLNYLKSRGNCIIIYTARNMKTQESNLGKVIKNVGIVTLETLDRFNIKYDEIYFGKPYANYYIDDSAVGCPNFLNKNNDQIHKELGFYYIENQSRNCNTVVFRDDDTVEKTSKNTIKILGEIFWYKNIPKNLEIYFPKFIKEIRDGYVIEKIESVTFSYLYINNLLRKEDFVKLLKIIENIHCYIDITENTKLTVKKDYINKIKKRYASFNYNIFKENSKENPKKLYKKLIDKISKLNINNVCVIHGDLNFTNILQTENQQIKFIDMKGVLDDQLYTIFGDMRYDHAKLYQSLLGYDLIINNMNELSDYQKDLIKFYENYLKSKFSESYLKQVKLITSSLFFTLIPFHYNSKEDYDKCLKFYKMSKNILN